MKKKQLRTENAKLRSKVATYAKLEQQVKATTATNYKLKGANDRLKRAVMKLDGKNRRIKARMEQAAEQIDALLESQLLLRSELRSNVHVVQLRGAVAAAKLSELEGIMPDGGKVKQMMVYEDEQEHRRKGKRYGTK